MIKKRIIGVITVLNGWAVQSFGYQKYLPLGKPTVLAKNLENWGADEIFVNSIDRSRKNLGPDFDLLNLISDLSLSTPLIYGGGISSVKDAEECIKMGCERITIDSLLHHNPDSIKEISYKLGSQSIIASIPLLVIDNKLFWFNYLKNNCEDNFSKIKKVASKNHISEFLLIDKNNEGKRNSFENKILNLFPLKDKPAILFGGISEKKQITNFLNIDNVAAIGIGNFLNYKEHMIQFYKESLDNPNIRMPYFDYDLY